MLFIDAVNEEITRERKLASMCHVCEAHESAQGNHTCLPREEDVVRGHASATVARSRRLSSASIGRDLAKRWEAETPRFGL